LTHIWQSCFLVFLILNFMFNFPILRIIYCHWSFPSLDNIMRVIFARSWFNITLILSITKYIVPFPLLDLLGFQFLINLINLLLGWQHIIFPNSGYFFNIDWIINVINESVPLGFVFLFVVFGISI